MASVGIPAKPSTLNLFAYNCAKNLKAWYSYSDVVADCVVSCDYVYCDNCAVSDEDSKIKQQTCPPMID